MEKRFPNIKRMVSTQEAALLFSVSPGTLQNWRSLKRGPRFFRVNRKILYYVNDLEAFFTQCPILTTDSIEASR